ncbi:hypothetical protein GLOIN_2v1656378 [Rhizophagus clarus]|uniref:Uncharacterized protein n=1 Tax=Rhizophagus clarus TaxID=94130 RepID=A0A8H3L979_9GLOM|nr:hypothetical protein GLOIN_2v1656378 [Rhizophagus clarus]
MGPRINVCCFCIPLKSGVIIITLLWLVFGIYEIVVDSIRIASPNKEDAFIYVKVQTIASIVFNALISFGAGFGLFVLTYANTATITWTVFKTEILKSCIRSIPATVFASDDEKNSVCNDGWRDFLGSIIMIAVISILLSLYFAIVISSYAKKRNEKETTGAKQHQYEKTSQL